jgi:hypothetical protein
MELQQFHNLGFQSEPRYVTKFMKLEVVSRYEIWGFHCGEDSFCGLLSYNPPGYAAKVYLELHSYDDNNNNNKNNDDDDNNNNNNNNNKKSNTNNNNNNTAFFLTFIFWNIYYLLTHSYNSHVVSSRLGIPRKNVCACLILFVRATYRTHRILFCLLILISFDEENK